MSAAFDSSSSSSRSSFRTGYDKANYSPKFYGKSMVGETSLYYVISGFSHAIPSLQLVGSTHSTGSLEGVTFLAVAIVDKQNMGILDGMIYFTMISALEFFN